MKIKDERMKHIRDLKTGEMFLYQDKLHIILNLVAISARCDDVVSGVKFVNLNSGMVSFIDDDILVTPVEVECKIVK